MAQAAAKAKTKRGQASGAASPQRTREAASSPPKPVVEARPLPPAEPGRRAHVILFGNEKGGSGKSTTAMHVAVALLKLKRTVATVDLDIRQQSLTRYVSNRQTWITENKVRLRCPTAFTLPRSGRDSRKRADAEEAKAFDHLMADLRRRYDYIIVDSPGSDTALSRHAHRQADTIVTPLNDSFVDFDLLGTVDPETNEVLKPSLYSEMVWASRLACMKEEKRSIDWVVMRNRVSVMGAKNKRRVEEALDALAGRVGFRIAPGFGERVIFREMFPYGLTLLDLLDPRADIRLTMSHLAARNEVRSLMSTLRLPGMEKAVQAL